MSLLFEAFSHFRDLQERARGAGDPEPTAMTLATADPAGRVSARTVLLKELDGRGFVFYTNFGSNKGQQILAHPQCALLFLWKTLDRQGQVKIEGIAEPVTHCEADAYFAQRPRMSQIGAWASRQSEPLADQATLWARVATVAAKYVARPVPRPPFWSGFRLVPHRIEFWAARTGRLHERRLFTRTGEDWTSSWLFP